MPELSRFYGIIVKMYFNDNIQHHKPHVHAYFNEYEASIAIDGELLAGSIPAKELKLVQAWLAIHEDELYNTWNKAVQGKPFGKIKPLK
jgi:hypothetical protein